MRWPNRKPHVLTPGMRVEQSRLAAFTGEIDWSRFDRRCLTGTLAAEGCAVFGCASGTKRSFICCAPTGSRPMAACARMPDRSRPRSPLPGLTPGRYRVRAFGTRGQGRVGEHEVAHAGRRFRLSPPPFVTDVVLAIRRA